MSKKILFRCDSNLKLGSGHFTRSFALAEQFSQNDWLVTFCGEFIEPNWINSLKFLIPNARYISVSEFIKENIFYDVIVFDLYFANLYEVNIIAQHSKYKISIVDDISPRITADLYISSLSIEYLEKFKNEKNYLFGPSYALIRNEILITKKPHARKNKLKNTKIAIFTGGVSRKEVVLHLLSQILNKIEFSEITVFGNQIIDMNEKLNLANVKFKPINKNYIDEIYEYNLIIASASTITWEILYLGIPLAIYGIYDNQRSVYELLTKKNMAQGIGISNHYKSLQIDIENLKSEIEKMKTDLSSCLIKQPTIDGMGSKRIFDYVINNI